MSDERLLTQKETLFILTLGDHNGRFLTQSAIQKKTGIAYSHIYTIRKDLVRNGIVIMDRLDNRSKSIELTPKGFILYEHLKAVKNLMTEIRAEITPVLNADDQSHRERSIFPFQEDSQKPKDVEEEKEKEGIE